MTPIAVRHATRWRSAGTARLTGPTKQEETFMEEPADIDMRCSVAGHPAASRGSPRRR
jgi:hypothetical protein